MSQESQRSVCSVLPEILECQDDDFINELNFSDWLEFNPSEHESAVENFESDNDDVASDFMEPSEEDTREYVKQH